MNRVDRFKILQQASGEFLCENIPDDWESRSEAARLEYIWDNVWQPLEYTDPAEVLGCIEASASTWEQFVRSNAAKTHNVNTSKYVYVITEDRRESGDCCKVFSDKKEAYVYALKRLWYYNPDLRRDITARLKTESAVKVFNRYDGAWNHFVPRIYKRRVI